MRRPLILTSIFVTFVLLLTELVSEELETEISAELHHKQDQPMQFFNYHRGIRTPEDATNPQYTAGHKTTEYQKSKHISHKSKGNHARTQSDNGVIEWTERGPGNVPGRTRALLVLPHDASNQTWLAGSATGGIWKTTNGGLSWAEKSADFPVYPISSFAISNSTIYAGTGESVSSIYSAIGDGIFKSTDMGETWSHLASTHSNTNFSIITRLISNPNNPDIILASTVTSSLSSTSISRIMKSIDGGNNWFEVYQSNRDIEQILFSPNNFNTQYAAINGIGVIKSINAGDTWALSSDGISTSGRIELAIAPSDPNQLYASCVSNISGVGSALFSSNNGGTSWSLVDVSFNGKAVDILGGQGFYDNTIAVDPFNKDIAYFGGVNYFRTTLGTGTTIVDDYKITENETSSFLTLLSFSNANFFVGGRLQAGTSANKRTVEIRFGSGLTQNAHRFLVPENRTSGVAANEYTYQNYTSIPFEAWDITNPSSPHQLMVSFRDQNRNGSLDLLAQNFESTAPLLNSREYVYVHATAYDDAIPLFTTGSTGGQETQLAYSFFPALASGAIWNPNNLPASTIIIEYAGLTKLSATTITVADAYNSFDGKNRSDQINLENGVHPDHHTTVILPIDNISKTFQILIGNDGGVFLSNISTTPGIAQGDWTWRGNGYNTSQFYGADKKPGKKEYIGGTQDNGTRRTPTGQISTSTSRFVYAIGGDGFETIWHATDPNKVIGSVYNNAFYRSLNGGTSWTPAFSGFPIVGGRPDPSKYPFVSKLAASRNLPDKLFAVGSDGVWRSTDFGGTWSLSPITESWEGANTFFDVDVSGANANIVWAGNGMGSTRKLHVSTDGGQTFSSTNNYLGATLGTITKLATHPHEPNTAYAIFSFSGRPKILRTTDLGLSWDDISGFGAANSSTNGFPDVAVYCVYVRPDNPNIIWAGTEIGIVESLDNGLSWAILDDFPKVSVWDMKGQDDEVVIATHGRGIWTATIGISQIGLVNPVITTAGTTPKGEFAIQLGFDRSYDSVQLIINNSQSLVIKNTLPGYYNRIVKNLAPGLITLQAIGYVQTAPAQSAQISINHFQPLPLENQYYDDFTTGVDWLFNGLFIQNFLDNSAIQSAHSYPPAKELIAQLKIPIKIGSENPQVFYRDLALIEPGTGGTAFPNPEFKDYVVFEATKNGIDWKAISTGYDATLHVEWLNAYNNGQNGNPGLMKNQNFTITPTFSAGDTVFFRYRLFSDASITGWGWAIDDLHIQVTPTGLEDNQQPTLTAFPNPSSGRFTVRYILPEASTVQMTMHSVSGKTLSSLNLGYKSAGIHTEEIDLRNYPGQNIVQLKTTSGLNKSIRVLIK